MVDKKPASRWMWLKCGIAGTAMVYVMFGMKLIAALPALILAAPESTWLELLDIAPKVGLMGFASGAVCGLLLPLSRFGDIGNLMIGAAVSNVYLFTFFLLCLPEELIDPPIFAAAILITGATVVGGAMGVDLGRKHHPIDRSSSEVAQRKLPNNP